MYLFPKSSTEKKETIEMFFPCYNNEPKDSIIRLALDKHDYNSLGNNQAQAWLAADKQLNELNFLAKQAREEKDRLWEDLSPALMAAKQVLMVRYPKTESEINKFGFSSKTKSTKKVPTEKSVERDLKRAAANANVINEAKAIADAVKIAKANVQRSSAMASLTVNEVTKTFA
jgi:hypothetical protein